MNKAIEKYWADCCGRSTKLRNLAMSVTSMIATSATCKNTARLGWSQVRHTGQVLWHFSDVWRYAGIVGRSIDDRVDRMSADELSNCGEARLGREPCPLILNPRVVPRHEHEVIERLAKTGILPYSQSVQLSNMLAVAAVDEKQACEKVRRHEAPRDIIVQPHLDLCAYSIIALSAVFNANTRDSLFSDNTLISPDEMRALVPDTYLFSYAMQRLDDMDDLLIDIENEARGICVVANVVTPHLPEMKTHPGEFARELGEIAKRTEPRRFKIPPRSLPQTINTAFGCLHEQVLIEASGITIPFVRNHIVAQADRLRRQGPRHPQTLAA